MGVDETKENRGKAKVEFDHPVLVWSASIEEWGGNPKGRFRFCIDGEELWASTASGFDLGMRMFSSVVIDRMPKEE